MVGQIQLDVWYRFRNNHDKLEYLKELSDIMSIDYNDVYKAYVNYRLLMLTKVSSGYIVRYRTHDTIYTAGDPADVAIYFESLHSADENKRELNSLHGKGNNMNKMASIITMIDNHEKKELQVAKRQSNLLKVTILKDNKKIAAYNKMISDIEQFEADLGYEPTASSSVRDLIDNNTAALLTKKETKLVNEVASMTKELLNNIRLSMAEVKALVLSTDTFEERMSLLNMYGIIRHVPNIAVEDADYCDEDED